MQKEYKACLVSALLLIGLNGFSQITPIGAGSTNEKLINYPISHSTGLPKIEIPLYSISFGDSQIPISLSYHASGLKLNQKSGDVGAGWSISTDFMISRTLRGRPDELYPMPNLDSAYLEATLDQYPGLSYSNAFGTRSQRDIYLSQFIMPDPYREPPTSIYPNDFVTGNYYDSEMDIFRYSLFGNSGRFVFTSRNPYTVSVLDNSPHEEEFKFSKDSYGHSSFSSKDANGNRYVFDDGQYIYYTAGTITTSWTLSKAYALNGDSLLFEYYTPFPSEKRFGKSVYIKEGCKGCFPYGISVSNYVKEDSTQQVFGADKQLALIEFPEGRVQYQYNSVNVGGVFEQLLQNIYVINLDSDTIRTVNFYYQLGKHFALLDSVKIGGGNEKPLVYKLKYQMTDEHNVPFDSLALTADHWNYLIKKANSSATKTDIPYDSNMSLINIYNADSSGPNPFVDLATYRPQMEFEGRVPSYESQPIFQLKEITYPSGGNTSYLFERNCFYMTDTINNTSYRGGGPGYRVKEVSSNDNTNGLIQRMTYTYGENDDDALPPSAGLVGDGYMLNFSAAFAENSIRQGAAIGVLPDNLGNPSNWLLYNTYTFSNQYLGNIDYAGLEENPVYYSRVTERTYNGSVPISKTVYQFDSLFNVVKVGNQVWMERNSSPSVAGRGVLTRSYKPEPFSKIILGYKPQLISIIDYGMFQSQWKKKSKQEFKYSLQQPLNSITGYTNVKLSNYAAMTPDFTGGMSLEGIYVNTNIESFFDFNVYQLCPTGSRRVLLEKTITNYTE